MFVCERAYTFVCAGVFVCVHAGVEVGLSQMTPLAIIKSTLFSSLWHIFNSPYARIFLLNLGP